MPDDPAATDRDQSRPAATSGDNNDYTLSIEEVSERYANAGHPRTIRTLQRYCVSGHLDARKVATTLGDKYFVTPQSVARHIAQIVEMLPLDTVATDRDQPRPVATSNPPKEQPTVPTTPAATSGDEQRQTTTPAPDMTRYVERLEREVEQGKDEREFLREQINRKDRTIDSLLERDRETNHLIRGLQDLVRPLLGMSRSDPPPESDRQQLP